MGCGKSKHAVVTSTTVVKSVKSDGGQETHTTKTITEKTKSLVVEDSKKETVTAKIDPPNSGVVKTDKVALALAENCGGAAEVVKAEKVNNSIPTDANDANSPTSSKDIVGVTEEKNESSPKDASKNVVPTKNEENKESNLTEDKEAKTEDVVASSKDIVGVTEEKNESSPKDASKNVVPTKNEENKESNLTEDKEAKTEDVVASSKDIVGVTEEKNESSPKDASKNVVPTKNEENKESNLTEDKEAKTEDVVEATEVKDHAEVKDSNEEKVESEITDEKNVKTIEDSLNPDEKDVQTIDDSSNPKDNKPKVEEQKDVVAAEAEKSTKVETKKEDDVEVIGADITTAATSAAAEPDVPKVDEATVAETKGKEP